MRRVQWTHRLAALLAGAALLTLAALPGLCAGRRVQLQILAVSDTHGMFVPFDFAKGTPHDRGSMAQLASALKALRRENSLLLDGGDIIKGNLTEIFHGDAVHPMAEAMNACGVDAWAPGNHEFNFGLETLSRFRSAVGAPMLAANLRGPDGGRFGLPFVIAEKGGLRVAVVGLATPRIARSEKKVLKGFSVADPGEEARRIMAELRGRADVIIALTHLGMKEKYAMPGCTVQELARACPGLDLIVGAHDHKAFAGTVEGVPVIKNAPYARTLVEAWLTFEEDGDGLWRRAGCELTLHRLEDFPPDAALTQALEGCRARAMEAFRRGVRPYVHGKKKRRQKTANP